MASKKSRVEELEAEANEEASEEQELESQRRCQLCDEIPDSIICLNCGHNIDIPCATRVILESQTGDELDISKINCLICKETTYLSTEVQAAIIAYGESEQLEAQEEGEEEQVGNEEDNQEGVEEGTEEEQSFGKHKTKIHQRSSQEKRKEASSTKKSKNRSEK